MSLHRITGLVGYMLETTKREIASPHLPMQYITVVMFPVRVDDV